jgi:hypothetical protein
MNDVLTPTRSTRKAAFPDEKKREVQTMLRALCPTNAQGQYQSAHISRKLNLSQSYVSSILNAKDVCDNKHTNNIGAGAWVNMHRALTDYSNQDHAETQGFRLIQEVCHTLQQFGLARRLRGFCGGGKTEGARYYCKYTDNAFHISCRTSQKPGSFLRTLLEALGTASIPARVDDMLDKAIEKLQELDRPLVVLDDIYYLTDRAMLLIKDLIDATGGGCGWLLTGEDSMEKRLNRGVDHSKPGYEALKDRTGRLPIEMPALTKDDKRVFIHYMELARPDLEEWFVTNARTYRDLKSWVDVVKRKPDAFASDADLDEIFLNKYTPKSR